MTSEDRTVRRHRSAGRERPDSLDARVAPFAVVVALAELSVLLPPGPSNTRALTASLIMLAVTAVALPFTWEWYPRWPVLIPPLTYIVSAAFLMLAVGGMNSGIVAVALIPVAWSALNLPRWMSAVVVGSAVLAWLAVAVASNATFATTTRLVVLWLAIGLVLSIGTHVLRARLEGIVRVQRESVRRIAALNGAMQELSAAVEPEEVKATAARLIAVLASPAGHVNRRGLFLQVEDGWVRTVAGYDEAGGPLDRSWLLVDHPLLEEAVRSRSIVVGRLDDGTVGPTLGPVIAEAGVTNGAWVPVVADGEMLGVLSVDGRGVPVPHDLLGQFDAFGNLTGLSLRNALAQQELRQQAMTDGLTGALNRRGLDKIGTSRRSAPFAVLTLDLDNLKSINDRLGHDAGDSALIAISQAASEVLRQGDSFARMGGDEFVAVLADADREGARRVAERILETVREISVAGVRPTVSIGIVTVEPGTDFTEALRSADTAMYEAKRNGGMRYQFVEAAAGTGTGTGS
jgi:diguanylate cyclase (GGDEF)-like protein